MHQHKVLILETYYIEDTHLIIWDLQFIDPNDKLYGTYKRVAYNANQFLSTLLNRNYTEFTKEQIILFNSQIKGKTKNLLVDSEVKENVNLNNLNESDIELFNKYPYKEIIDSVNKGLI